MSREAARRWVHIKCSSRHMLLDAINSREWKHLISCTKPQATGTGLGVFISNHSIQQKKLLVSLPST